MGMHPPYLKTDDLLKVNDSVLISIRIRKGFDKVRPFARRDKQCSYVGRRGGEDVDRD